MACNECDVNRHYAAAFDVVLSSLERRYERLHRAWEKDPSAVNTAKVNAIRLVCIQAERQYEYARVAAHGGAVRRDT